MEKLYKQILSKTENGFKIDAFNDPKEMADEIKEFYNKWFVNENILQKFKDCFKEYFIEENSDDIYIRGDEGVRKVLVHLYGGWSSIPEELKLCTGQDESENVKNKKSFYSIKEIQTIIDRDWEAKKKDLEKQKGTSEKIDLKPKNILDYFNLFKNRYEIEKDKYGEIEIAKRIEQTYSDVKPILDSQTENVNLQDNDDKKKLQRFMDSLNSAALFIKPLYMKKKGKWLLDSVDYNIDFYEEFNDLYQKLTGITKLYDKTRNYVTKKPYSTDTFKINFESSSFLSGWATDYEKNGALLFIKGNQYYLGVVASKFTNDDIANLTRNSELTDAVRIIYDFQKPDNKNVPRLFIRSKGDKFAPAVEKYNLPVNEIIDIYDNDQFTTEYRKKDPIVFRRALTSLIDYFKEGFKKHESYKHYEFNWKSSGEYQDISDFYKDTASSCYMLHEEKINFSALLELANKGKIYLFEIYSKDFSSYSKGRPNLHTSYWKLLFSKENLNDLVLKLNGQAEVFFRPTRPFQTTVHEKKQPINNKNPYTKQIKGTSTFDYDIVKDRRFTKDKFFLHCPITLNYKEPDVPQEKDRKSAFCYKFNSGINQYIREHLKDINLIGIDRGERNLLYYTVIDGKGNIIEQASFNTVENNYQSGGNEINIKTDYHQLLAEKEKRRKDARQSWTTIENIKELKSGYLSHIVHKIALLMVKYNAIVVLEELNRGFKKGRFKVEKQVYQKFEKALIDKLNYLVFKDRNAGDKGHYLNGYQLTAPFTGFDDIEKQRQTGFLFYIWPNYTSKIDPVTGFVNLLDTNYKSVEKSQKFFKNFDNIRYNSNSDPEKSYFEFTFCYKTFSEKKDEEIKKWQTKPWTVCAAGKERYRYDRDKKTYDCYDVTAELIKLFDKYGISYKNSENLVNIIANKDDKAFFERLHFLLGLTLQLRHIYKDGNEEKDFILSPVMDKDGNFFDSRKARENQPKDADANGAFNIARKGLMVLNQIKGPAGKPDVIKNADWFDFAQKEIASLRSQ
jgi:CRISPR-associated protein Cpf1